MEAPEEKNFVVELSKEQVIHLLAVLANHWLQLEKKQEKNDDAVEQQKMDVSILKEIANAINERLGLH